MWLSSLHENNPDMWYYPWDGRGFLQLTHPINYFDYWDFRGRGNQTPQATRNTVLHAHGMAGSHRAQAQNYNADDVNGTTPLLRGWRDDIGDEQTVAHDLMSPADSAGFYWAKMRMVTYADLEIRLERRELSATRPPNPQHPGVSAPSVTKVYYHSENFRDASAAVNLPAAVGHPNHPFNGYIARCGGFGQVLAVVGEYWFPDAHGGLLDFPEGCKPRRD